MRRSHGDRPLGRRRVDHQQDDLAGNRGRQVVVDADGIPPQRGLLWRGQIGRRSGIHGDGEVSLEVESEFKVLTGKASNGIPVIANRKLNCKVRLKDGEWAVVAGLVSSTEARSLSGIAGLAGVPVLGPLLSQHGRDKNTSTTLLVIKPRVISPPASDEPAPAFWVGSESRLPTQM